MDNLNWAEQLGYKTVMWSFAYADWDNGKQMCKEKAIDKIMSTLHNGEVMLLHPTSSTNAEILKTLILELKKQGFGVDTGITKQSGFWNYPLWIFEESLLRKIDNDVYEEYANQYKKL